MSLLSGLLWAFLRRWYGGLIDDDKHPVLGGRGLQSVVMIAVMFGTFVVKCSWWVALLLAVWIQFQFWSRAIGCILDCGRSLVQNKKSYNRWYRVPLDWVYDKLGKQKYCGFYDWWYTWLRYGLPMIVPAVVLRDWGFIVIGIASAPTYFCMWRVFEVFPDLCRKMPRWCGEPKNLAEIVYGFIFGVMLWQG